VTCNISLEFFWQGLQVFLRPDFNQRPTQEVMSIQKGKSPNYENFGNLDLGVSRKMTFGCSLHVNHKKYYKKEGGGFPLSPNCGESCETVYAHDLSMHQKCSNYALTNLLFSLCKSIWIIDPFIILLGPHHKVPTCPSYPEMLQVKECTLIHFCSTIFICRFAIEAFKEFGGASHPHYRRG